MSTDTDLLNALLAEEHAAIYAFAVIGARLDERPRSVLRQADGVRRSHRDALAAAVRRLGGQPAAPQTAYAVVGPVDTTAGALATARLYSETLQSRALESIGPVTDREARDLLAHVLTEEATYRTRLVVASIGDLATRPSAAVTAFPGRRVAPSPPATATATQTS